MRRVESVHEPGGVDLGVELGRRERGVAEQFLDPAQVAAAGEEMGREGVAQRMRGGAVGQPERAAQFLDRKLDDAGRERPAAGPDEQGPLGLRNVGAERRYSSTARWTGGITGTERILPPLPVTVIASVPSTGASRRCSPSASEMRRPDP